MATAAAAAARQPARRDLIVLAAGLALVPVGIYALAVPLPVLIPEAQITSFHVLAEILAIVVAVLVFAVGYHVLDEARARASLMLACAFVAVAGLDLLHILTYPGLPDFITLNSPHKTASFWLAARLVAAGALLAYVALPLADWRWRQPTRGVMLALSITGTLGFGVIGVWYADWLPRTYTAGSGLTPFKIAMEWLVIGLHAVTLVVIARVWGQRDQRRLGLLAAALLLLIGSECFFTLYATMADSHFVLGHVYKVLAYVLIYQCMFVDSVREPVRRLDAALSTIAREERRFQQLLQTAPDGVMVTDGEGRIRFANRRLCQMLGAADEVLAGQPAGSFFDATPGDRAAEPAARTPAGPIEATRVARRADGSTFPVALSTTVFTDDGDTLTTTFVRDVTREKRQEAELQRLALHDDLTGLPNRWSLHERLDGLCECPAGDSRAAAVLLLDLDNFKLVNDQYGHQAGDELLTVVASRLRRHVRERDLVARIGGDEFAIVVEDVDAPAAAGRVAAEILEALAEPCMLRVGREVDPAASVGISLLPAHGTSRTDLLRYADLAMYEAKRRAPGSYCAFSAELDARVRRDAEMVARLRRALVDDRLTLLFQPQIDTRSGAIAGVEALVRWTDDVYGAVSPGVFVPLAERSELIAAIDGWVLTTACEQIAAWERRGIRLPVAVNLSASQFGRESLTRQVASALERAGASPELLEIEITESAAMADRERGEEQLAALYALGITLSLDDFGTGHSSLAHLQRLRVHKLKIDGSFLRDVGESDSDRRIFETIVALGHNLGLTMVAEWVETEAHLRVVRATGCERWQGWAGHAALPPAEIPPLLRAPRERAAEP